MNEGLRIAARFCAASNKTKTFTDLSQARRASYTFFT
jgi:hypothetical protein